jgi:hypothetical protein
VRATRRRSKRPGGRRRSATGNGRGWKCIGSKVKEGEGEEKEGWEEEGRCRPRFSRRGGEGMERGREGSEEREGDM